MAGQFRKMHGLGNDFVVIDARATPVEMTSARARAIADRREGIGCDQLIVIAPSTCADIHMRIWNADGTEVEACGNASRAVALIMGGTTTIETAAGLLHATVHDGGATVDMGEPRFDWAAIPLAYPMDTAAMPVAWDGLTSPAAVNVGNPHIIFFVDDLTMIDLAELGPLIETDPLFPARINVNVATITAPHSIALSVWERGAGLTRACGTGACATAVAALTRRLVTAPVTVTLPGGDLIIDWSPGMPIRMTGPATEVYRGTADWDMFG